MSELIGVDRLLVVVADILQMAVVDILLVAVIDKLASDILVLGKLAAVLLVGKCFDIVPDFVNISEFEIGNQSFYIDFPITGGYKRCSLLQYALVYHNCGKHVSLIAIDAWIQRAYMLQDTVAQATDKLVEDLWHCEIVGVNCLDLAQISMEASQNHSNVNVVFGVNAPADEILIVLPGITAGVCNLSLSLFA
ncbi:hypothetical protein G9A89_010175 [Geosiphon pyriformis]|nr:hypothetical protein G9A89_010175 [Geosiphon pyriformis]